jgi:peptidoglycan/LPS O-acetylase OafA/YrhL
VWADDLKVWLVVGVIAAHAVAAWTANEGWVLQEPPVREPLLTLLSLASLVGVLFGRATFFLIAGSFTPPSLARKGPRRFVLDRLLRLGVPLLFFLVVMAPVVEFASDDADWDRGFPAFVAYTWQHPAPGPTWFLEVLLLFSVGYATLRAIRSTRAAEPGGLTVRHLVAAIVAVGLVSFLIRLAVPFASERDDIPGLNDLYLAQAPAWLAGFVLGVAGAERGWFDRPRARMSRWLFRVAWSAVTAVVLVVALMVGLLGYDVETFYGGWRWPALILALLEGAVAVAMPLWLCDVFRRRVRSQSALMAVLGRAAFGAFLVHQVVLVGAVLAARRVAWPPEVELVAATGLAVVGSFGLAALLVRVPGVSRVL